MLWKAVLNSACIPACRYEQGEVMCWMARKPMKKESSTVAAEWFVRLGALESEGLGQAKGSGKACTFQQGEREVFEGQKCEKER